MLKRNARVQRKRVKALTDPKPEFVSLVGAGANKTPFRALRADSVEQDIEINTEETATKSEAFGVARIEFSSDTFADEETVVNWLASGGYADAKVERTDTGFVVAGDAPEGAELIEVPGEGFVMYVSEVSPGATSQKSDLPTGPQLLDMTFQLYSQIRDGLHAGDHVAAKAALTDFSGVLDAFLETVPGSEEPTMKAFIDAVAPEVEMTKETTEKAAPVDAEVVVAGAEDTTAVTTEGAGGEEIEAVAKTEGEAAAEGEVVAEEENSEEEVAVAAKTEEEVADPIAALSALVGDLTKSVKELGETVSAKTDELAQRVAAVEDVRQTRKGADVDETTTSKSGERSVSDEMAELRQRSMLGMRG